MPDASDTKKKLGERLIEAGLITQDGLQQALELQKRFGGRLGDCLVELRHISEQALLRFLATEYRTRYVAAEKLSKVKIPQDVLDKIPVRMAEQQALIPLMIDGDRRIISIVMAEPQNLQVIEEVRLVTDMAEVYAYIGLRSAIQAAIKKHYYGDPTAFAILESGTGVRQDVAPLVDYYEHAQGTDSKSFSVTQLNRLPTETNPRMRPSTDPRGRATGITGLSPTSVRQSIDELHRASVMSDNDFVETLHIMVGLLEMRRKEFKGHSSSVARGVRTISMRLGLPSREVNYNTIAAYLHDLGKRSDRHLTLLSIRAGDDWKVEAKRYYRTPIKLFETVHLPVQVNQILAHLYEAYDGTGLPEQRAGDAIPSGSRIIAVIDAFEDLHRNPQNFLKKTLPKDEALNVLGQHSGSLFDPKVMEAMRLLHSGDLLRQRLLADTRTVLYLDPDESGAALLLEKLSQKGVSARYARSAEAALDILREGDIDLIVSEVNLGTEDGFLFATSLRQVPELSAIPLVFVTSRSEPTAIERGLAVGAVDYIVKPYMPEVVAGKIRKVIDERASQAPGRPVHGSFDEMALADVIRTIGQAKRSGQLAIPTAGKTAEIYFDRGRVVHAIHGHVKGELALMELLDTDQGEFHLDPNYLILEHLIDRDAEVLLREHATRKARGAAKPAAGA